MPEELTDCGNQVAVRLKITKTDQTGQGCTVALAATGRSVCPVQAYRKYLAHAQFTLPVGSQGQRAPPGPVQPTLEVRVVSLQIREPSVAVGLVWMGGALQLAVQRANERYAQRGLRFLVHPVDVMINYTCAQTAADGIFHMADYYYRHNLDQQSLDTCDLYFTNSCMDYFQMLSLSSEWNAFFFNNGIALLSSVPPRMTPTYLLNLAVSEVDAARTVWGILRSFGWSRVALLLDTRATTVFYAYLLNAAKALSLANNVPLTSYPFQPNDNASIATALLRAQENSRVFFLSSSAPVAYLIMDLASQLGMTNGEYVFLNVQPVQNNFYGKASFFNNPKPLMLNLTWNLIFLTFHESDDTEYERQLNGELRQLAYEMYNVTYEPGFQALSNYPTRMAYTAIELISDTLAGKLDEYRRLPPAQRAAFCAGDHLASLLFNRTIPLPHATVAVDPHVHRWMYRCVASPDGKGLVATAHFAARTGSVLTIALPVAVGVAVVVLGASCAALFAIRRARRNDRSRYWWLINENEWDGSLIATGKEVVNPVSWRNTTVWLTTMKIHGRCNLPLLARLVPDTTHPNVNALLGVVILPHQAILISDYCKRGSLLTLLEVLQLDHDFQLSMARDLAKGLSYLHNNIGRPHGCLSPGCCLIDEHFTLRIGQFGFVAISHALSPEKSPDAHAPNKDLAFPADIYAAGQILLVIIYQLAHTAPSQLAIRAAKEVEVGSEKEAANPDIQRRLTLLANRCLHSNPVSRPTAKQLFTDFGRLRVPGQPASRNVVESIIRRFEAYTETLDEAVRVKTEELMGERKRCDDLLSELLPRCVVDQLRNHEKMVAEFYDSVSVFFSDLDNFVDWMCSVPPEMVIGTVTALFSAFDGAIQELDVYKVETVRDSYMAVSGIPVRGDNQHVVEICRMAIKLLRVFAGKEARRNSKSQETPITTSTGHPNVGHHSPLGLRCGIHSGPCAAGVIGMRVPRYCLFGDTVNVAARMNTNGQGGRIHLSQASHDLLAADAGNHRFCLQERGLLFVKVWNWIL
ncbi:uncharacterized protein LOC129597336 [Paramacrobiotus metropolitanus]|uniref:uncharacterized protein LOC129597336 n=1 Tax=Paramacrobiotus metropolitanus TaxID=2943436 RepID=UPI002445CE67|nr:uncharacterized protein LOC129597336 [Paramacrobiotus metropolitanus]